jgi:hypothetical protein
MEKQADDVNVEGGEPQPPVSSCASGIYKKLDESKRQIRLLELHPGSEEEPISGNLVTLDLPALQPDFEEDIFFLELINTADQQIKSAMSSGKWVLQDDVDRWEFIQTSLIWLFRYRLMELYHILRDARGTPTAETVDRLKDMRLSRSAALMQKIPTEVAKALLSHGVHHSWTYDLNGLIFRLCAQGTRSRRSIIHFAEQMTTAIDKFVSEDGDGDGVSALTSVDVPGLQKFLAEVDLGCWPPFAAVSWFWGDAKPGENMELDGKSLDVPRNAIRALRDLRDSDHSKMLWIDAVCIDQDDKAERASQILLMSDIYSFAELTYVWLGNDDLVVRQAMVFLQFVLRICQQAAASSRDVSNEVDGITDMFAYVPTNPEWLSDTSPRSANPSRPDSWKGYASTIDSAEKILDMIPKDHGKTQEEWRSIVMPRVVPRLCHLVWPLFEFPWFSRLWVLQEAALSKSCEIVFSAKLILPWKDLQNGACHLQWCDRAPRGLKLTMAILLARRRILDIRQHGSPLLDLIVQSVDQECSDPRDYIFGLLGLTVWAKSRLRFPSLIQPSYVKPVSDCMRDATIVMLQQQGDLSALLYWCRVGQSPTWAVHWHRHKHIGSIHRPSWPYGASVSTSSSRDPRLLDLDLIGRNRDLDVLLVKGLPISIVHSTSSLVTEHMDGNTSWSALEEVLQHVMDLSTRTQFEFSPHTITSTLMTSVPDDQASTPEAERFRRLENVVNNLWDGLHDQTPEECLEFLSSDNYVWAQIDKLWRTNILFVTEAGQLCVGQKEVQEGDKIVQLFGLHLPALLRPEQSWYTFAGLAYLNRELLDVRDTSTLPPEIYEIR